MRRFKFQARRPGSSFRMRYYTYLSCMKNINNLVRKNYVDAKAIEWFSYKAIGKNYLSLYTHLVIYIKQWGKYFELLITYS